MYVEIKKFSYYFPNKAYRLYLNTDIKNLDVNNIQNAINSAWTVANSAGKRLKTSFKQVFFYFLYKYFSLIKKKNQYRLKILPQQLIRMSLDSTI